MNREDSVPGEGSITYDIRFYAIVPGGEHIKLIINVEAQKNFYPGYDLVTRAIFYCARMLSAQCGTEFTPRNYDDIKKVYSIWICMDVPAKAEYTISRYSMSKEDVHGHAEINTRYDLMEVVMIYLGKAGVSKGTKLHALLNTLLATGLKPWEKKHILEQEYGIAASVELEGGLDRMCNLSEWVEEQAIERGMQKGMEKGMQEGMERGMQIGMIQTLFSLVDKGRLTLAEAAEEAGMSEEDFNQTYQARKNHSNADVAEKWAMKESK